MAASNKSASQKPQTKKAAASKKVPAKQAPVKKVAAKQLTQSKVTAAPKKAAAKKAGAKQPMAKQPAAKQAASKQAAAQQSASKVPVVKSPAKRSESTTTAKRPKRVLSPLLSNEVPEVHEVPPPRGTTKDGITYTKDFDVKFLNSQRDELLARRASEVKRATRLEDEAESLIEGGEMGDVQFDDEGGEGDTMVVQRDLDRLLSSQARQTVDEIDLALDRIKVGTYGYSEVSGLPIPRERLEALPETTVLAVEKVSGAGVR
jgi:RNA polymerase-binding transcription factor DksA